MGALASVFGSHFAFGGLASPEDINVRLPAGTPSVRQKCRRIHEHRRGSEAVADLTRTTLPCPGPLRKCAVAWFPSRPVVQSADESSEKWEASCQGGPPNHVAALAALMAGLERWKSQHAANVHRRLRTEGHSVGRQVGDERRRGTFPFRSNQGVTRWTIRG